MTDINKNVELEKLELNKLNKDLENSLQNYRKTMSYIYADVPIGVLCLPVVIEKALNDHGLFRVYDLFDCNFTEVKGLGVSRIRDLTARLNEFLSIG